MNEKVELAIRLYKQYIQDKNNKKNRTELNIATFKLNRDEMIDHLEMRDLY